MELIQMMEEECSCTEVIFQDYVQSRKTYGIFVFFEGKDDYKYYWCRISPFIGGRACKTYVCNCKENVAIVHEMICTKTKRKADERTLYFADNDFEKDNNLSQDIYVTPTYSIENLYVSDNAIRNMIIGEFGLSGEMNDTDRNDFEKAVSYLVSKRDDIITSMLYANAWYSLQYNKSKNSQHYPRLSAVKEYSTICNVVDKEYLKSIVPHSLEVSEEELQKEIQYLMENPVERLRGKYFEQTMPKYIMKVFQDSNKKDDRELFSKRRRVCINVGVDNMIAVLTNYADVPSGLIRYIMDRLQKAS